MLQTGKKGVPGNQPWYRDGLRFQCTQCGDCCTGAPGYVWFNREEGTQMAALVGMDVDEFYQTYARKIGIRYSLREFPNGDCVFFDGDTRRCSIYSARPRQCRTWPFWGSNLKTPADWQRTCQDCPGSGMGKLYRLEQIEEQRKAVRI